MGVVSHLVTFGLRQVMGDSVENLIDLAGERFTDHSRALARALAEANERAWQALGMALAGNNFLTPLKSLLASADVKALRDQVRPFVERSAPYFDKTPADFRKACLTELQAARKDGLLSAHDLDTAALVRQAAGVPFSADSRTLIDGSEQAVGRLADDLAPHCPHLARLLRQPAPSGPPLLVAAFAFFFRREVEMDEELAHGLTFDALRQLTADQAEGFANLDTALKTLGGQFDTVLSQLGRVESTVVQTHEAVLDLRAELERLGQEQQNAVGEVRQLIEEALGHLGRAGMQPGEVRPQYSFSIRGENERRAVHQLLDRFHQLPEEQRRQAPALLNGLGKLQVGAGDFTGARQTFDEVAQTVGEKARAEARFNAYRAALGERRWDEALLALHDAAQADPDRFALFPLQRYQARRILGAGGFGTAFLCYDRFFKTEVVVKTLHDLDMERSVDDVFREAQVLRLVHHPAVIGVLECNYADLETLARPYIVMDYFPGVSLKAHLDEHGPLAPADLLEVARQVAAGMREAHRLDVLHRDLKPDNVLVRRAEDGWEVKIIDFGLALRRHDGTTPGAAATPTVLADSVAGTVRYAPPEQLGELPGIKPGPYSDVYAFGKLCCFALFRTTEPKRRQWATIPEPLAEVLEKCTEQDLEHRYPNFDPVLRALEAVQGLKPALPDQKAEGRRQKAESSGPLPSAFCPLPSVPRPGEVITTALGLQLAWLPPGTFLMGSPTEEVQRRGDEVQHGVRLTQGFYLAVHPVTQAQWRAVMGTNPGRFPGDDRPAESVTFDECVKFCARLSEQDGRTYRLPTEAEWEYACRAGTAAAFHFGATLSTDQANYDGRDVYGRGGRGIFRGETTPVGSFPANAWGLCDMHGNVYEWCADWYGNYPGELVTDPAGPSAGDARVLRGGSWFSAPWYCRSAYRYWADPSTRASHIGFRVVVQDQKSEGIRH